MPVTVEDAEGRGMVAIYPRVERVESKIEIYLSTWEREDVENLGSPFEKS